jgi:hypothetical protein
MPKDIVKHITALDEIYKKLEYNLEDHGMDGSEVLEALTTATETLVEINDELDLQINEEGE